MDKSQAIALVQKTFTSAFDKPQFLHFIRNLVNHLDESKAQNWTLVKDAYGDRVNHFARFGTYTDPRGEKVDVLVVHLRRDTTLSRGRVTLRNFVADYLTTGHGQGKAAVLAAFVSPEEVDWRFSFIKLDYSLEKTDLGLVTEKRELTPARRYSFLVGGNETSHTAQKQFLELLQTDQADPRVADLEQAFGIEKVTREFYLEYEKLFRNVTAALESFLGRDRTTRDNFKENGVEPEDFAKKLLGQIVFLYFLQKKGWFGVDRNAPWGTGRKDFLRHLFNRRNDLVTRSDRAQRPPNFFNDILEPLFYEALAVERDQHYYGRFHCRIPFLNGGLFEPLHGYDWVQTDILLPNSLFSNDEENDEGDVGTGILDVFDRYNFTVNEAEPLEKEVAVDPEMLGKVFENLLPEYQRHKEGTYYTPRVIVHFMCQQALINHLATRLADVSVDRKEIEAFIQFGERFADFEAKRNVKHEDKWLPRSISQNARRIDEVLASTTVCDPAIGSGAFAVGMMQEIVRARLTLAAVPGMPDHAAYELKRHAIHHSIYGVDEDPGAVEIAKLRLWLSMVVDEEDINEIKPLPNLDYKIMQGNSLLDEFAGIKLFDDRLLEEPEADVTAELETLNRQISEKSQEFVELHSLGRRAAAQKLAIENEIKRLKKQKAALLTPRQKTDQGELEDQLSQARTKLARLKKLHDHFFNLYSPEEKRQKRQEMQRLEWEFMEATLNEQSEPSALADLRKLRHANRKPFFLWKLHFFEIFRGNRKFDLVLANPPFVRMELIKEQKPALERRFPHLFSGRADLYVYFYGLGLDILRDGGCLTFISSNTYLNSKFGEKLRKYFMEVAAVATLIDFAETKVFDAVVEPAIIVLRKTKSDDSPATILKWDEGQSLEDLPDIILRKSARAAQSSFTQDPWRLENPAILRLLDHLQSVSEPLGKYVEGDVLYGVKTGLNDAFIISDRQRNDLLADPRSNEIIKPFVRGRDVARWATSPITCWLIYTYHGVDIRRYPLIEEHLRRYKPQLEARATQQKWYELQQPQYRYSKFFEGPKIIYQDIARYFGMAWDDTGAYLANTCYFIPTNEKWLLGVLLSSTMQFHVQKTIGSDEGGFIRLFAMHVKKFPIPGSTPAQKAIIERLVEYLLWLHGPSAPSSESPEGAAATLVTGYFEQVVNGLVYELFFPEPLHAAGLHLFRLVDSAQLRPLSQARGQELAVIRAKFEETYASNHPLRQNLFALDSIEEVRIIEGKA